MTKGYKWLSRLIDKITKNDCPNNNYFTYYGHEVTLQSGTRDYVDVTVSKDNHEEVSFTFDFWTKEVVFESYREYEERDAVIKALKVFYSHIDITDEPWDEEERFILPMLSDEEYDQEVVQREYVELLSHKAA